MNTVAKPKIELLFIDTAVQHCSHDSTETSPIYEKKNSEFKPVIDLVRDGLFISYIQFEEPTKKEKKILSGFDWFVEVNSVFSLLFDRLFLLCMLFFVQMSDLCSKYITLVNKVYFTIFAAN